MLTFYSDDPSSNPTEAYSFSVKFVLEKNENKQKWAGLGTFRKQIKALISASIFITSAIF